MQPFSPPVFSAAISTYRPLFSQLWIIGAFINAKSEQAVNRDDLRFEENPVIVLKVIVTLLS